MKRVVAASAALAFALSTAGVANAKNFTDPETGDKLPKSEKVKDVFK